ncbi:MAG TPA: hypothetical protein DDZ80_03825 [Cyanobacteria bacterium UBA8803]|nr:hypothetical protein [Cyanobacteria bacterium UBA9273]HBL57692.1 hypothetical protein [Cyanobacteria bacterium UBA8803]
MTLTRDKQKVAALLKEFNKQFGVIASRPLIVSQEVISWTSNQPFLAEKICQLIVQSKITIPKGDETWIVEQIVRSRLIENWEKQVAGEHLSQIRDSILGHKECVSLLSLYQRVLQEGGVAVNGNPISKVLLGSGLVSNKQGRLVVANRIYEAVFDGNWVARELANAMELLNSDLKPGQIIDRRYEIIKELGSSKFGRTYLAKDKSRQSQPQCVVKQLTEGQDRFRQKVEILENINHEQIPRLLAFFEENQQLYVVQDFIAGGDLSEKLTPDQKWNKNKVINLLLDILEILDFCHKEEIIHGNIKPSNLRLRQRDGKIVLIDFGVVEEETYSKDIRAVGMIAIQALTGLDPSGLPRDANGNIIWRRWLQEKGSTKLADILDKMVSADGERQYPSVAEVLNDLGKLAPRKRGINIGCVTAIVITLIPVIFIVFVGSKKIISVVQAASLSSQGESLYNNDKYPDAEKAYKKAVKIDPRLYEAWTGLCSTQLKLKNPDDALKNSERAIDIKDDYTPALNCKGLALNDQGLNLKSQSKPGSEQKFQEAVNTYELLLRIDKNYKAAWNNRGESLLNLGDNDKAKAAFDEAIKLDPNYTFAWTGKGEALINLEQYKDALEACNTAIGINPKYERAIKCQQDASQALSKSSQ